MAKYSVELSHDEKSDKVSLGGIIDEDFKFDSFIDLTKKDLYIDLGKIVQMNSCGVRSLIGLIKNLSDKKIAYTNCPCIFINQINMVKGLLPDYCRVVSFYAPYFSPITQEEIDVLIETTEVAGGKAPAKKHPETNENMQFDDLEDIYFKFLKR